MSNGLKKNNVFYKMEIIDPDNKLSKTQKSKIRAMIQNNDPKTKILDAIHYDSNTIPYKDFEIENDTNRIVFSNIDPRTELSKKLKNRLHHYEMTRNNNFKNDAWKMYYQVLQHPMIRKLPDESLKQLVADPDTIKAEANHYKSILNMIPIPLIKNYIHFCLSKE